jgi:flagellar M-ring protein FliF
LEPILRTLQGFGIGRLAAILGGAAGVAAVLAAIVLHMGGDDKALLYSNLDLKEAGQIAAQLDQSGIKYELKGDGSTIMVGRDKVNAARLLLSGKGLPTSGSVGYEIFDSAPALGQTDFVQNLNMKRATEGELARTIGSIQGVQSARVQLSLPKRQLFEQDAENPSASVMLVTGARRLSPDQVRTIRNLVAAGVPGMRPERVAVGDQSGDMLAGLDDASGGASGVAAENDVEEKIRKQVKDMVEAVVGAGKARVTVHADVDQNRVTTQEKKFDPDGQVTLSTRTTSNDAKDSKPGATGVASASSNIPGAAGAASTGDVGSSTKGTDELTNYENSSTTTTTVNDGGAVKRLSVSVAVDGVTGPSVKGKTGPYTPRTADEMKKLEDLVRTAVGVPVDGPSGAVKVVNVRFQPAIDAEGGAASGGGFAFGKDDVMRIAELGVMGVVAVLLIFFVARPMMKGAISGASSGMGLALAGPQGARMISAGGAAALAGDVAGGQALLSAPAHEGIDIARIDGQVQVSSVKKVADFVERHPDESVSIIRGWLHEA